MSKIFEIFATEAADTELLDVDVTSYWDCKLTTYATNRLHSLGFDLSDRKIEIVVNTEDLTVIIALYAEEGDWESPENTAQFQLGVSVLN